jgi:hypothetical protein
MSFPQHSVDRTIRSNDVKIATSATTSQSACYRRCRANGVVFMLSALEKKNIRAYIFTIFILQLRKVIHVSGISIPDTVNRITS